MYNRIITCCIVFIFSTSVFICGIEIYPIELAGEIKIGNEIGQIGWNENLTKAWGGIPVILLAIDANSKLFVNDIFNKRLNIYSLDFKYIMQIDASDAPYGKNIYLASTMRFDYSGNLIGTGSDIGLIKMNTKGEILYSFSTGDISENVWSRKVFFPYKDNIIYYEGTFSHDKIKVIDKNGKIQENNNLIDEIDSTGSDNVKGVFSTLAATSDTNNTKFHDFLKTRKIVFYDERLLTGDCADLREYYNLLKGLSKNIVSDKATNKGTASTDTTDFSYYESIGYDSDKNSYWQIMTDKKYIAVFSKFGELLDHFAMDRLIVSTAIAPNGDIYFFSARPVNGKFQFYKITRRW